MDNKTNFCPYYMNMECNSKSFNLRKRANLRINKHKKHGPYADHKSHQKVNKVIRVHTRCELSSALCNNTINDFILPGHTQKFSQTWWDCSPRRITMR
jgi:hypothetical protein